MSRERYMDEEASDGPGSKAATPTTPLDEGKKMTPEEYLGVRKRPKETTEVAQPQTEQQPQTGTGLIDEELQRDVDELNILAGKDKNTKQFAEFLERFTQMSPEERRDILDRSRGSQGRNEDQTDMAEMFGMARIPLEIRNMLKEHEKDWSLNLHKDALRNWMWEVWVRIAYTVSESRNDMQALSQVQSRLSPELRKELDAITLMYQKYIKFSTSDKFESAMGDTAQWKAEHLETLFRRPELLIAFRIFEEYQKKYDLLRMKDTDLSHIKEEMKKELRKRLQQEYGFQEKSAELSKSQYSTTPDLDLAVEMGFRFGEYLWRTSERAAFLDTTCRGSGEFWLRRIFHTGRYIETSIEDGELTAKPEVAKHIDQHLPDLLSAKGEKFWLGDFDKIAKGWGRKNEIEIEEIDPKTHKKKIVEVWNYEKQVGDKIVILDAEQASGKSEDWYKQARKNHESIIIIPKEPDQELILPLWYQQAKEAGKIDSDGKILSLEGISLEGVYPAGQKNIKVREWYKRMKREGSKAKKTGIDEEGFIWDLSECPLDQVDFKVGLTNPNAGVLVGHVFKDLGYAEAVRSYLVAPDGFANSPTVEALAKSKGINFPMSVVYYTDKKLKERKEDEDFNKNLNPNEKEFRIPIQVFRQEIIADWARGMREWQFKNGLSSPEIFAHDIEKLSPYNDNVIGEKERKKLLNEMFKVFPYWLQIPFKRLNWGAGFLQLLWEIIKKGISDK